MWIALKSIQFLVIFYIWSQQDTLTIVCEIKEELSPIGPRCLYPEPVEGKSYCLLKWRNFRKSLSSPFEILSKGGSWSLELGKKSS